jgi:hypothetical protein
MSINATYGAGLAAGLGGVEPQKPRFCHVHAPCHVVVTLPGASDLVDGPASAPLPQNRAGYGFPCVVTRARVAGRMLCKPVCVTDKTCIPCIARSFTVASHACPFVWPIRAMPWWRHACTIRCGCAVANTLACRASVEADKVRPVAASPAANLVNTHALGSTIVAASSNVEQATSGPTRAGVALHEIRGLRTITVIVTTRLRAAAPRKAQACNVTVPPLRTATRSVLRAIHLIACLVVGKPQERTIWCEGVSIACTLLESCHRASRRG